MAALIVFAIGIPQLRRGSIPRKDSLTPEENFLVPQAFGPFSFNGLRRAKRKTSLTRYTRMAFQKVLPFVSIRRSFWLSDGSPTRSLSCDKVRD